MRATGLLGFALALTTIGAACVDDESAGDELTALDLAATTGPAGTTQTTLIAPQQYWYYRDQGAITGSEWRATWDCLCPQCCFSSGPAPLGYGESYVATTVSYGPDASNKHRTTYLRTPFSVPAGVRALVLRVMYDDGFVFYLNGHEGGRASMPSGAVTAWTPALGHEADNRYVTFDISAQVPRLLAGDTNWLAFEVHQQTLSSSDLAFDAELIAWVDEPIDVTTQGGIPRASTWHLWDAGGVPTDWRSPGIDDSEWSAGPAPLGYGETYLSTTTASGAMTTYFRKQFTIEGSVHGLAADVMYDDGFVAYLNGTEIQRTSMPAGAIGPSTPAANHEAAGFQRFDWDAAVPLLTHGENTLAVEVHQTATSSSDLVFDLGLEVEGSWAPQASGTPNVLNDVVALDSDHAWAVGDAGTLTQTSDGGASWSARSIGTDADLAGIALIDADHAWVVGAGDTVLQTSDGGASWVQHQGVSGDFYAVAFASPTTGWIGGRAGPSPGVARLYRTVDGGATWTPQSIGADWVLNLVATDADHAWALGRAAVPSGGATGVTTVYATADGGATWTPRWSAEDKYVYMGALAVIAPGTVLIAGGGSPVGPEGERILRSTDAGLTWSEPAPTGNDLRIDELAFVGDQGWALGWNGSVLHSDDSGATWTVQRAPEAPAYQYQAIAFAPDGLTGWIVGTAGLILHTRSGGA